jgi:hypothetical protein
VDEAQRLLDTGKADEAEKAEEIRKSNAAELRETTRKLKQKLEAEKVEKREKEKKERNERKAAERKAIDERKAERERKKQGRDSQKAIQIAAKGRGKVSTAAEPAAKRSCGAGGGARRSTVHESPSAPLPTLNSRGRRILQPRKY